MVVAQRVFVQRPARPRAENAHRHRRVAIIVGLLRVHRDDLVEILHVVDHAQPRAILHPHPLEHALALASFDHRLDLRLVVVVGQDPLLELRLGDRLAKAHPGRALHVAGIRREENIAEDPQRPPARLVLHHDRLGHLAVPVVRSSRTALTAARFLKAGHIPISQPATSSSRLSSKSAAASSPCSSGCPRPGAPSPRSPGAPRA